VIVYFLRLIKCGWLQRENGFLLEFIPHTDAGQEWLITGLAGPE